ncbi:ABC transporter substrate-binding protein [Treponema parvum]|uniref:ABC transporter substrate-binding protein n=1 Tax=Treponema parvum TaxID=138851 RepID=UPI001AEC3C3E|nr:ABC transporter substrate-binding protein [Treponema parvum]QTQ15781.1 ABC transporter substrate-binding protein [Treponema parvum]
MKFNKKGIIAVIIIAVIVLGSAAGFLIWRAQPKGATVAVSTLPDSLNPVLEQNISGLNADELLFDGLVNFEVDKASGSLYSDLALAESIVQNPVDKKTYTVMLRDVMWHDNTPVTSEDVVYSFAAYTDEANNSPKRDYLMSFIKSVTAEDEKTVKIEFINPIPEFRAYPVLTFKIIPARYGGQAMQVNMRAGENERKFATAPIGTGPFKLATWEIGKWLTFEANGMYFKNTPQTSSLVMKRVIDPLIRINEMRQGRINLILETNPMDRAEVEKIPNVDVNSYIPYAFYQVAINTKLFPNAEGREAMAMALDRPSLIPSITDRDTGVILNYGPFPSNLFSANIPEYVNRPMPNNIPYNIQKAKLLASSGGVAGQNAILLYPDSMGEFGDKMANGIVSQLAAIGLNVEAKRTGDRVFSRMVNTEKSYELALIYCEGFDNLYSSLGDWYRSNGEKNITGVADSKLNSLFDAWEKEIVTSNWIDLTLQIDKRICELSPALFLCSLEKDVYSRGLENVAIATDNPFLSVENWKLK